MRFKHEASWILLICSLLLRCFSQCNSRTPYPIKFDRLLAIDFHGRARAVARALVHLRRGRDAHRSSAPALAPAAITECGIRPRHKCVGGRIGAAGGEVSRPERDGGGLSAGACCRGARGAAHHRQGCVASPHCRQSPILLRHCDHEERTRGTRRGRGGSGFRMDMVGTRHRNAMLNAIGIATSDTFHVPTRHATVTKQG